MDEAMAMARLHGAEGIVLREVARRVGVSHNAAYRHFADRDELLAEIAGRSMEMLVAAMQQRLANLAPAADAVTGARQRLSEVGRAYVEFALAESGLFKVAFGSLHDKGTAEEDPSAALRAAGPFALLSEALDELVAVGHLDPERREHAEVTCWSAVHGFAVLHVDGPLRSVADAELVRSLDRMLATLDAGLGALG